MANRIHIDDGLSLDIEALRDMLKPIAKALDLGLPAFPQTPIDYEVGREGDGRHITLRPSATFDAWRDQVVRIIEAQTRYPLGAPSDFKPT